MLEQDNSAEELQGFDSFEITLGDKLRGERATMGKSLSDISADLKIRAELLEAIESCDVSGFPAPSFIAGYVRSYAEHLGLDPEGCFTQFCAESGFVGLQSQFADTSTRRSETRSKSTHLDKTLSNPFLGKKGLDHGLMSKISGNMIVSVLTLALFVSGLGYLGYTALQEVQRVSFAPVNETVGTIAAPEAPQTDIIASLPQGETASQSEASNEDKLAGLYQPTSLNTPILTPRMGPISSIDPQSLGIYAPEINTVPAADVPQPVATEKAPDEIILFAAEPSWVRVYTQDGTIIFEKILNRGESYLVAQEDGAILRAGNSGSVYFSVADNIYGPAGNGTSVVDDVELTPDYIMDAYIGDIDLAGLEVSEPLNAALASAE
ncbi:MAG: RodZ domain-containing protein [Pseudomonadota bacterium]